MPDTANRDCGLDAQFAPSDPKAPLSKEAQKLVSTELPEFALPSLPCHLLVRKPLPIRADGTRHAICCYQRSEPGEETHS